MSHEVGAEAHEEPSDDYMPKAVGHKIIVLIEERPETFEGTEIVKPDQTKVNEQHMMQVGRVIDMGPDAYKDTERFPSGPWCGLGDWILLDRYGGTKFRIGKQLIRIVNDDHVDATVAKPTLMVKFLGA
jgi:co-chaperonin GroES (HSP10)